MKGKEAAVALLKKEQRKWKSRANTGVLDSVSRVTSAV